MPLSSPAPTQQQIAEWIVAAAVMILSAAVLIALPMYHDHAIYWRGGELLLHGSKLSDDYLVKQPLIYVLYAIANLLFGYHEWSYRLLDALIQTTTAAMLVLFGTRIGGSTLGMTSGCIYAVTYSANGYVLAAHPESYVGIIVLLVTFLHARQRPQWWHSVLEGALLAMLIWLKVTFALVAFGLLAFDIVERQRSSTLYHRWLFIIFGMTISTGIGLALLYDRIEWSSLPAAIEYMRFYSSLPPIGTAAVASAWHNVIRSAAEHYTMTLVMCGFLGWLILARRNEPVIWLWAAVTCALVLSILVERKFGVVHLWRLLPVLSVPIAAGVLDIWQHILALWKRSPAFARWTIAAPLLAMGVAFSPVPRFIESLGIIVAAITDTERYNAAFQRPAHNVLHRATLWKIAGVISTQRKAGERVLVLSACTSQLYVFLREPIWNHFMTTLPMFATSVPERWRQLRDADIRAADWLVVAKLDRAEWLFGHQRSSWESLRADSTLARYVDEHFVPTMETDIVTVLRRTVFVVSPSQHVK
ncbi:MAG: glycosyltransferase family 39 protein [Chlorobi bacterium]|nr:glycosyltransferase family 39 protein [Chlorobiota bacterium]